MFGQSKQPVYRSPGGAYYRLFEDMASQPHLLVAGTTGSGKSVVINGIIYTCLLHCPDRAGLVLIDPKRVELSQFKRCPHVHRYASEPDEIISALEYSVALIEQRFRMMERQGVRMYPGGDVYVIIDELAPIMTMQKRQALPLIQKIANIGRAAKVHLIVATQSPVREILCTPIKCCLDARVALRTRSPQDSRNIMGASGCELLPKYGKGYYMTPDGTKLYNIPKYPDETIANIVDYWTSERCLYRP